MSETEKPSNDEAKVNEEAEAKVDDAAAENETPTDIESNEEQTTVEAESADEAAVEVAEVAEGAAIDTADSEGESAAAEGEEEPTGPVEIPNLVQIIEGAVLAADKPLSIDHIIQLFPDQEPSRAQVREAIAEIQSQCEGRGFEFKEVASGYRFQVRAEYGDWIGRLWEEKPPRYTRALLETLALIAYKQPITRGDIEEIRGVSVSTNIIRTLLEREWIRVVGHRDVPGRPSIYATTKTFLDYFNLNSLDELPTLSEIKDLDKVNAELDLEGELIEPRSLSLEEADQEVVDTAADDEALDEVTDKVNEISENIKNLFKAPEEEDDFLDDDEIEAGSNEQANVEADGGESASVDEVEATDGGGAEEPTAAVESTESESREDADPVLAGADAQDNQEEDVTEITEPEQSANSEDSEPGQDDDPEVERTPRPE